MLYLLVFHSPELLEIALRAFRGADNGLAAGFGSYGTANGVPGRRCLPRSETLWATTSSSASIQTGGQRLGEWDDGG